MSNIFIQNLIMKKIKLKKKHITIVFYCLILLLFLFKIQYYFFHKIPLWYDSGFYIANFFDYKKIFRNFNFNLIESRNHNEPLIWILANIFKFLWLSYKNFLILWIIFSSFFPIFIFYLLFQKKQLIFLFTSILYLTSIVQFEAFFWIYLKQIIWISCILLSIHFLNKKKYIWLFLTLFFSIFLHRHTSLFLFSLTFVYIIYQTIIWKIDKKILLYFFWTSIIWIWFYFFFRKELLFEAIHLLKTTYLWKWMWWYFLWFSEYIKYELILIMFSFFIFIKKIYKKNIDIFLIWYFMWLIWILFKFVNYNRQIIFFDIFTIILASNIFYTIRWKWKKIYKTLIITFFIVRILFFWYYNITHSKSLISKQEFSEIKKLSTLPDNKILMVTHRNYTPRIAWYWLHKRISPWYSYINKRTKEERNKRRLSNWVDKCNMLKKTYPNKFYNIYIFLWENQIFSNYNNWKCFKIIEKKWWYIVLQVMWN